MTAEKKAEKKALRSRMVAWRKKIQPSLRQGMSQCILGRLFQMDAFRQAQTVFAYASMPDEVQLDALLKACLSQGKRIGIPEITGPGIMEAAELESMEDLVTGKFGIRSLAPEVLRIIPPEEIDLMIVPGAAFTRGGERLGLGGGYYDRFLPRADRACRIACIFEGQIVPEVPAEEHDQPVDYLVTEIGIVNCCKEHAAGRR